MPPVAPMLAKPVDGIPDGDYVFEPKWDGFRSIVFRDGPEVEIGSRNERPMTRYFPELAEAVLAELPPRSVIDGEVVVPNFSTGRLDTRRDDSGRVPTAAESSSCRSASRSIIAPNTYMATRLPGLARR